MSYKIKAKLKIYQCKDRGGFIVSRPSKHKDTERIRNVISQNILSNELLTEEIKREIDNMDTCFRNSENNNKTKLICTNISQNDCCVPLDLTSTGLTNCNASKLTFTNKLQLDNISHDFTYVEINNFNASSKSACTNEFQIDGDIPLDLTSAELNNSNASFNSACTNKSQIEGPLNISVTNLNSSDNSSNNDITVYKKNNTQDLYLSDTIDEDDFDLSDIFSYYSEEEKNNISSKEPSDKQLYPGRKLDSTSTETICSTSDVNNPESTPTVEVKRKGKRIPKFKRNMVKPSELNFTDLTKLEPGNNECLVCKKTFKLRNKLLAHFSIHPPKNPQIFDLSKKESSLIKIDVVPPTPEEIRNKPFVCAICPKRFRKYGGLEAHCNVHTGEKPYVCNVCSKAYRDKAYLKGHAMLHKGQVLYECHFCKKSFTRRQNLTTHYLTHTGERPHSCDICGQSFRKKNLMVIHYRLHTNDYPFSCKECGRRFRSKWYLINHALTHSDGTVYECEHCPKTFTQKRWLLKHIEFHEGKRKHECPECYKCFKRKADLEFHIQGEHDGDRPYICRICRKSFTREYFLNAHFITHSKEETSAFSVDLKLNIENQELDSLSKTLPNESTMYSTNPQDDNDNSILRAMLKSV